MQHRLLYGALTLFIVALFVINTVLFTVEQTKQAIVLRFGALTSVHTQPGLKVKVPFIDEVIMYEKRVMDYDLPPIPITTVDQKRLVVDTYTRYLINDPVLFFQSIKPANEMGARLRLETIISSSIRNVLGKVPLRHILATERSSIMKQIEEEVKNLAKGLGLQIIDVRIIRTELPPENREAVFARMNAELNRIASENRAKGAEKAQGIRAKAEAEQTVILAEADQNAQIVRGAADAKAIEVISTTLGKDVDFYNFFRSMQVYKESIQEDTTMLMNLDNDLFRFFSHPEKQFKSH